jgi:hypothetical protein
MPVKTNKIIEFHVNGYTGVDLLFAMIYSNKRMAKRIAKMAMKPGGVFGGDEESIPDPDAETMILKMPDGPYRIVDASGNVEIYRGDVTNLGMAGR